MPSTSLTSETKKREIFPRAKSTNRFVFRRAACAGRKNVHPWKNVANPGKKEDSSFFHASRVCDVATLGAKAPMYRRSAHAEKGDITRHTYRRLTALEIMFRRSCSEFNGERDRELAISLLATKRAIDGRTVFYSASCWENSSIESHIDSIFSENTATISETFQVSGAKRGLKKIIRPAR